MKQNQTRLVLRSNLRLLVLLRETLSAQGDNSSALFTAIKHQANLTGSVLPEGMRLAQSDLKAIQQDCQRTQTEAMNVKPTVAIAPPRLPSRGECIVMDPRTMRPLEIPDPTAIPPRVISTGKGGFGV